MKKTHKLNNKTAFYISQIMGGDIPESVMSEIKSLRIDDTNLLTVFNAVSKVEGVDALIQFSVLSHVERLNEELREKNIVERDEISRNGRLVARLMDILDPDWSTDSE